MCGVLAFISDVGAAEEKRDAVLAALETLHHRGPDETGCDVVGGDVVLAHKRLSIIDLELSQEPLRFPAEGPEAGRYLLTFNGEIYNYLELRRELSDTFGVRFATHGDGEVIVAGYHHWGEAVLDRLRGMFAFLIWDRQERKAFGARDPFGIKPLHCLQTADGVYVASEKKALMPFAPSAEAGAGDSGIDVEYLSHYLMLQYVPEPRTLHRGILRIGPGECITYTPGGTIATRRYYRARFRPRPVSDPATLYRRIQTALRESVRLHMRSDVEVGAFLSSGIDSTAVVALAQEVNPRLLTFTAGFDVDDYSEVGVAQDSARSLGVTTIPTTVTAQDVMEALPRIVWHLDDPVADPALVPLYFVAKKAAEHVTVVLSGDGADELFGGYAIYREPLSLAPIADLPAPLQRGLRALSHVIPEGVKGKSFLERGTTILEERYYGNARIFSEKEKRRLQRRGDPSVHHTDVTAALYREAEGLDPVTTMQYVDLYTWLRGDILVKADRMSMAHSLELRVPFLDREVFEVAAGIPADLKLRGTGTKFAMRRALEGIVPPSIVDRRKLGFPTPTRVWLRREMYAWARQVIAESATDDLIDLQYAVELLDEHRRGQRDNSRKVWTVLVFCLWHAIFVARSLDPGIATPPRATHHRPSC